MTRKQSNAVYVIDDDPSVRKALTRLIKSHGFDVRPFDSADEFLAHNFTEGGPACLVLDVRMPGTTGIELHARLRTQGANLPIVFITAHGTVKMGIGAMKDGAVDFLTKPVDDAALIAAINAALSKASDEASQRSDIAILETRLSRLTPREREVLILVVQGFLNKQIALQLGIVEKTVKVHRARIMEKMEVRALADLVRIAVSLKLVPVSTSPDSPAS